MITDKVKPIGAASKADEAIVRGVVKTQHIEVPLSAETDPTVPSHVKGIEYSDIEGWNDRVRTVTTPHPDRLGIVKTGSTLDLDVLGAPPIDTAGGDLRGTYPNPTIGEVEGVGAELQRVQTDFVWAGWGSGTTTGGRGISPGMAWFGAPGSQRHVKVWCAADAIANLYWTTDDWASHVFDTSLSLLIGPAALNVKPPCLKYLTIYGVPSWVATSDSTGDWWYAPDIAANYNTDGSLKPAAWLAGTPGYRVMADIAVGPTACCMVGNHTRIVRTTDWTTFTDVFTGTAVFGGIDTDGTGLWIAMERDTGILRESTDDGLTWTAPQIYTRTSESAPYVAASSIMPTGGVCYGNGRWLVTGSTGYAYSLDGIHWTKVATPLGSFYGVGFDGVRFYATNPNNGTDPAVIYQLLVSSIPMRKQVSMEQGFSSAGPDFLSYLPSASGLGTDANGKIIDIGWRTVTAEQFGAKRAGTGNDYAALKDAIAFLASIGGGVLRLNWGSYAYDPGADTFLTAPEGVSIEGMGWGSVLYSTASASGRGAVRISSGSTFRNFCVDSPGGNRHAGMGACGITGLNSVGALIERVKVANVCGAGINMQGASEFRIIHCLVRDTGADGVHMPKTCRDGAVVSTRCYNTGDDAFSVVGYREGGATAIPEDIRLLGCIAVDGHSRGFTVVGGKNVKFIGCDAINCMAAGFYFASEEGYDTHAVRDIVMDDCTIREIGRTYFGGFSGQIFAFAIRIAGRTGYRANNIRITNTRIANCAGRNNTSGSSEASTNYLYATSCDGLSVGDCTMLGGEYIGDTPATVRASRFVYLFDVTDAKLRDSHLERCNNQAVYIDEDSAKTFSMTGNTFVDPSLTGNVPVLESASNALHFTAFQNTVRLSTANPSYFVRFTATPGVVNDDAFFMGANDTAGLTSRGVPADSSDSAVVEVPTYLDLPASGLVSKLYVIKDRNLQFRGNKAWSIANSSSTGRAYRGGTEGPDGRVYLTTQNNPIYSMDVDDNGSLSNPIDTGAPSLNWRQITMASDRCLYPVVNGGSIWRGVINPDGTVSWATTGVTSRNYRCNCSSPNGIMWVSVDAGDIYRVVISGSTITLTAMGITGLDCRGLEYSEEDNSLYATSGGDIHRIPIQGDKLGTPEAYGMTGLGLSFTAIKIARDGNAYVVASNTTIFQGIMENGRFEFLDLAVSARDWQALFMTRTHHLGTCIYNSVTQKINLPYLRVR